MEIVIAIVMVPLSLPVLDRGSAPWREQSQRVRRIRNNMAISYHVMRWAHGL
jgi:hypothetical protein